MSISKCAIALTCVLVTFPTSSVAHAQCDWRFAPRMVLPLQASEWRDATPGMPPGSRYAVISGDLTRAERFVMRVEMPRGYRVARHSGSKDANLILLSGTLLMGHGRSSDSARMRDVPLGSLQLLRAGETYSMRTIDGASVQIFGVGPFRRDYVSRGTHWDECTSDELYLRGIARRVRF